MSAAIYPFPSGRRFRLPAPRGIPPRGADACASPLAGELRHACPAGLNGGDECAPATRQGARLVVDHVEVAVTASTLLGGLPFLTPPVLRDRLQSSTIQEEFAFARLI